MLLLQEEHAAALGNPTVSLKLLIGFIGYAASYWFYWLCCGSIANLSPPVCLVSDHSHTMTLLMCWWQCRYGEASLSSMEPVNSHSVGKAVVARPKILGGIGPFAAA
jgi:hypothetical protein